MKLLVLLLSFTLMTVALLLLQTYYQNRKHDVYALTGELTEVEVGVLNAIQAQKNFIIHEPINPNFFETGHSVYAAKNDSISAEIAVKLDEMANNHLINGLELENEFRNLKKSLAQVTETFHELADFIWLRGYKDYGLEGEMREFAHLLEDDYSEYVEPADILMLRRHEKDFIIRREEKYILRFEYQIELIRYKLIINNDITAEKRDEIEQLMVSYTETFKELVFTEKRIGLKESKGLKMDVDHNAQDFIAEVEAVKIKVQEVQAKMLARLQIYYISAFLVVVVMFIFGSIRISKNMTQRIKRLTNNLNKFVQSNFKESASIPENIGNDEVGELARNFKVLEDEIVIHFGLYRQKVERRTKEILDQKDELEKKQDIIEQKNKDILDSIKYAKKIQDSILPEKRYLDQLLREYFVLYKPKDIVSGDFYWIERTQEKIFVAVADCTGHGVPGAFMSIMGNNFLNQAVNEKGLTQPDQILSYMNIAISSSLGQNHENGKEDGILVKVQDGMDIALISIDYSKNELMFSGAQRPLVITRGDELIELKGDRFPVGGSSYGEIKRFSLETIQLESGDNLYMFSDGYADQFGGENNKKFKYSKLRELLLSMRSDSPDVQRKVLAESLQLWKGTKDQVDDICVLGIRV